MDDNQKDSCERPAPLAIGLDGERVVLVTDNGAFYFTPREARLIADALLAGAAHAESHAKASTIPAPAAPTRASQLN